MTESPTTVYIDHSIVTRDAWWPCLRRAVSAGGTARLVLSLFNLFEIGAASDNVQQDARLAFLEKLNPLWAVERRGVQKHEVKRFLWTNKFGVQPEDLVVITPSLSVVNYLLSGSQAVIGITPKQFMRGINFDLLNPLKKLSPAAQTSLKAADPAVLKRIEPKVFTGWIGDSVPLWGPDGKIMPEAARIELATFCYQRRDQFLSECPCLAVENAITIDRTKDRARKPLESDGPDLQHVAVAMAYCDIFFTGDGNQANSASVAQRMLPGLKLAEICRNPDQFEKTVTATKRA